MKSVFDITLDHIWRFAVPGSCTGIVLAITEYKAKERAKMYLEAQGYPADGLVVFPMGKDETYSDEVPYAVITGY